MWNKKPAQAEFESIPWLTEMELTDYGKKQLFDFKINKINKKAVFVGFSRCGNFYKILMKDTGTAYTYSKSFWKIKKSTNPAAQRQKGK